MKKVTKAASRIVDLLRQEYSVPKGEEVFFLSHVLAHLLLAETAQNLSLKLKQQTHRFAIRKLKASIQVLSVISSL